MEHAGSDTGRDHDLPLNLTAEAELARSGFRLAFPPALERRYILDTAIERARELTLIIRLGSALYLAAGAVPLIEHLVARGVVVDASHVPSH